MNLSRRVLLGCAALALAWTALSAAPAVKPLRILILGGTGYLGPATIEAAQARGHQVTMFNRGKTRPELFPGVERLQGDRDPRKGEGLKALEKGEWDVVIDNSAYYPRLVKASAELLAPHCRQYILISSISAYKEPNPVQGDETAPMATMPDPTLEDMGKNYEYYGALKALCEQAASKAMPGRVTVIRPGYIVGPDDNSGRFTYWPVRFSKGGDIGVPGTPTDPLQIIDVRDLGRWLVTLAESGTVGTFNACGPEKPLTWGRVIQACQHLSPPNTRLTWLSAKFVAQQEGLDFPIWAPFEGDSKGFHTWSNAKAIQAGLRFRPVEETVNDTLTWYRTQEKVEKGRTQLAGPSAEAELKVLAAWKAAAGPK